jgi:hypothetical protein
MYKENQLAGTIKAMAIVNTIFVEVYCAISHV